jgi:hypothetical protein
MILDGKSATCGRFDRLGLFWHSAKPGIGLPTCILLSPPLPDKKDARQQASAFPVGIDFVREPTRSFELPLGDTTRAARPRNSGYHRPNALGERIKRNIPPPV